MPWHPHNLTEHADATSVNGPPVSHVVTAERTQHVFHRGLGLGEGPQVLVELWWRPGEKPQWGVLGAGSGADMSVFGAWLASHVVESDGTQQCSSMTGRTCIRTSCGGAAPGRTGPGI
jgi:hypothetical protein